MRSVIVLKSVSTFAGNLPILVMLDHDFTHTYDEISDLTIHKLFATRADLYRTVYTHPKVKVQEQLCFELDSIFT